MKIKNNSSLTLLISIILLFISSCSDFKEPVIESIENFNYEISNGSMINFSLDAAIKNENKYAYKLWLKNIDVFLGEENIGSISMDSPIRLLKNTTSTYHISGKLTKSPSFNLFKIGKDMLFGSSKKTITIKGTAVGKKFLIKKKKTFEETREIDLKKLIEKMGVM